MKEDKNFNDKVCEQEELLIDFSQSMLMEAIMSGDLTAIIFFLKTKGKYRGYTTKIDLEMKEHSQINVSEIARVVQNQLDKLKGREDDSLN